MEMSINNWALFDFLLKGRSPEMRPLSDFTQPALSVTTQAEWTGPQRLGRNPLAVTKRNDNTKLCFGGARLRVRKHVLHPLHRQPRTSHHPIGRWRHRISRLPSSTGSVTHDLRALSPGRRVLRRPANDAPPSAGSSFTWRLGFSRN